MVINLTPDQLQAFSAAAIAAGYPKPDDYAQKLINDIANQLVYAKLIPSKDTLITLQDKNIALQAQVIALGGTPV